MNGFLAKLLANHPFANVTFDEEFVIRGLKIINGNNGYFVSMPSRKRADGTHQDICHPINNRMREKIERLPAANSAAMSASVISGSEPPATRSGSRAARHSW